MKNCYYPIDFISQLTKPSKYETPWGEIVIWQDDHGNIVAMDNTCRHMYASLAEGKVVDGCLRCPYHHWRYQTDGQIASIPSLGDVQVAKNFKTRTYPTKIAHGIVFVYFGDQDPEDTPPLPKIAETSQADYRFIQGQAVWRANIDTVAVNSLDFQHAAAMHMFGNPRSLLVPDYEVVSTDHSLSAELTQYFSESLNLFPKSVSADHATVVSDTIFLPATSVVRFNSGTNRLVIVFALSPISQYETRVTYMLGRNFHNGPIVRPMFDIVSRLFFLWVQYEDRRVVEKIKVVGAPDLRVKADKLLLRYAQLLNSRRASEYTD
jgi:phenylpropionate dioxygenase-like ring-hydroxylating dioxygenase large terminal subunit